MYQRLNQQNLEKHKLTNLLHSGALMAGMVCLLGLVGWIFAGSSGMRWVLVIGFVSFILSPRLSSHMILRLYAARPLPPSQAPGLYSALGKLARRAELPNMPMLYYLPTRALNAFATGNRDNAAIAVTGGMLHALTNREMTAVLAHEVSHLKHNDLWIMNLSATLGRITSLLSLVGQILLFFNLPLMIVSGRHIPWAGIFALVLTPWLMTLLQLALSRTREFEADLGAASLTGDPQGLAAALWKIEQAKAGWLSRIGFPGHGQAHHRAWQTHPNANERIKRLMAFNIPGMVQRPQPVFDIPGEAIDIAAYRHSSHRPRWRRHKNPWQHIH